MTVPLCMLQWRKENCFITKRRLLKYLTYSARSFAAWRKTPQFYNHSLINASYIADTSLMSLRSRRSSLSWNCYAHSTLIPFLFGIGQSLIWVVLIGHVVGISNTRRRSDVHSNDHTTTDAATDVLYSPLQQATGNATSYTASFSARNGISLLDHNPNFEEFQLWSHLSMLLRNSVLDR